jgi:carbon-monoxide dehydrogenase small subunit
MIDVTLAINGESVTLAVHPGESLLHLLRRSGHAEVKSGCESGDCGSCLVLLDEKPVNACMVFAAAAAGSAVTTVRGIGTQREPHVIQEALAEAGAVQCGYCTPGMVVAAYGLLKENPSPTEEEVRSALDGSLCRCTGYGAIVDGILLAASRLGGKEQAQAAGEDGHD